MIPSFRAAYPATRFRRCRQSPHSRADTENTLSVGNLIWPVFVRDARALEEPVGLRCPVFLHAPLGAPCVAEPGGGGSGHSRNLACFPIRTRGKRPAIVPKHG